MIFADDVVEMCLLKYSMYLWIYSREHTFQYGKEKIWMGSDMCPEGKNKKGQPEIYY
jgi:hypothetical protein